MTALHLISLGGLIDAAIGFVACAFCPAIGRSIKALFVKDTQAAETDVKNAAASEIKKA
jgi:hypothetical protein